MPSPTDSTWPISATSASVPKLAIWFFRIAEISAARISISLNPLHGKLQAIELAPKRRIDHARPDLDDEPAQQAGIDLDIDSDLAADRFAQLLVDGVALLRRQLLRADDMRRDLAARARRGGGDSPRSSPAERRAAGCCAKSPRKLRVSAESCAVSASAATAFALRLARHHGAADKTPEIAAVAQHGAQALEIAGHGVELLALVGEIEQRRRIAVGQSGYAFRFRCHVRTVLVTL